MSFISYTGKSPEQKFIEARIGEIPFYDGIFEFCVLFDDEPLIETHFDDLEKGKKFGFLCLNALRYGEIFRTNNTIGFEISNAETGILEFRALIETISNALMIFKPDLANKYQNAYKIKKGLIKSVKIYEYGWFDVKEPEILHVVKFSVNEAEIEEFSSEYVNDDYYKRITAIKNLKFEIREKFLQGN